LKLNIPDVFIDLMKEIEGYIGKYSSPSSSTLIDVLEWASKNPSSATRVVEEVRKLKATGKDEFTSALFGWKYKPDTALKRATWRQEERRKRRSLLFKLIINAKKNGYRFETAGGAECVVKKSNDYLAPYVFKFNVDGVETLVYHRKKGLVDFV